LNGKPGGHAFDRTILREYDIRGTYGKTLDEADAHALGRAFATVLRQHGGDTVVVGRDGRLSSPSLEAALVAGLTQSGVDVVRIGLGPTPMTYYAEASMKEVQGGIHVTGSHNPGDDNGFKIVLGGRPFFGADLQMIGDIARDGAWIDAAGVGVESGGTVTQGDILAEYVARVAQGIEGVDRAAIAPLRIGWDAGNGAGGPAIEALVARLPGEHHLLYTHIDGHFPNHHPDPTVEANLSDLRRLVADKRLDFGMAFDGDADRIAVIDARGRVIWGDQLLMILAQDVLLQAPGATIIADVKSSQALFDRVADLGGVPIMGKTGHSLVKSKMKETGALLGGEMTGHVFFAHRYYGFDDALYAAVRLIAATVRLGRSVTQLRDAMPDLVNTPELRFAVPEARKLAVVDEVRAALEAAGACIDTTDGVRVTMRDGWWLLRASNTQAGVTARAEAPDAARLACVLAELHAHLAAAGVGTA
jgi:phosphomannomutase